MEETKNKLEQAVEDFVKRGFSPNFGKLKGCFKTNPIWARLCELGSRLWLDTGSIEDSEPLWTQEFSALTTNNTLLNREIQTGRYDSLVGEAEKLLASYEELSQEERKLEIAFILNAWHGLRLVEKYDAFVSVEEHTDLAHDLEKAVECAIRYHAICPERFIIKLPFTPAGVLATRRISALGIPVNHTLGFSARQNYVIARIGRPAYVNVFLGRLNGFVVTNELGNGSFIGEKATLASQEAIRKLRQTSEIKTMQIGASFRSGGQVRDLAGIDVMTIPPKVVAEFISMGMEPNKIEDKTEMDYPPGVDEKIDREAIRLDTLWDIDNELVACIDALEKEDLASFTPDDLIDFFKDHNCSDVLVRWSDSEIETSTKEGKIPQLDNWKDALADKSIGLDTLMNLAGLNSFIMDQKAMDQRVERVLQKDNKDK